MFLRVSVSDWVPPTAMLPNATLVGLAARAPSATPAPETGIVSVALVALLAIAMLPARVPAAVGAYVAVSDAL